MLWPLLASGKIYLFPQNISNFMTHPAILLQRAQMKFEGQKQLVELGQDPYIFDMDADFTIIKGNKIYRWDHLYRIFRVVRTDFGFIK